MISAYQSSMWINTVLTNLITYYRALTLHFSAFVTVTNIALFGINHIKLHKAIHAQDKDGMSWYDAQFGHMPWLYDEECDDEKIAKQVKSTRGAYGIPLSWYGHIQGRPNPDYWML